MSDNPLTKINKNLIIQLGIFIALALIVAINARLVIDNILRSRGINEKIVAEANPRLNRRLMGEAVSLLQGFSKQDQLTSSSPSATLENEALEPGRISQIELEIRNASGITGAAAGIAAVLTEKGYIVSTTSTAPARQNKTYVLYKTGLIQTAQLLATILMNEGWPVEIKEASQEKADVVIVLGK